MKKILLALALLASISTTSKAEQAAVVGPKALTITGMSIAVPSASRGGFSVSLADITGTVGVQVQASQDGTVWTNLYLSKAGSSTVSLTATASGVYTGNAGGFKSIRAKVLYLASGQGIVTCILAWSDWIAPTNPTTAVTPVP